MRYMLVFIAVLFYAPFCFGQAEFTEPTGEQRSVAIDPAKKFFKDLVAEQAGDNDLTKLMRERLGAAVDLMNALENRNQQGYIDVSIFHEAQKQVGVCASDLLEGKELIFVLTYIRDVAKQMHERTKALSAVGARGGATEKTASTRFQLLDAEVRLLREIQKQSKAERVSDVGGPMPPPLCCVGAVQVEISQRCPSTQRGSVLGGWRHR